MAASFYKTACSKFIYLFRATFAVVRIVINTIGIMPRAEQAAVALLRYVLVPFAANHRAYTFFVLTEKSMLEEIAFASNVSILQLNAPKQALLRGIWMRTWLIWKQRKCKADLVIQAAGNCWSDKSVPQIVFLQDYQNGDLRSAKSWQQMMRNAVKHASAYLLFSNTFALHLKAFSADAASITLIPFMFPAFEQAATEINPSQIKEIYTGGAEYILCADAGDLDADELKMLLKAYAQFKKRQHTGMKLVLLGAQPENNALVQEIASYRYRAELVFIDAVSLSIEQALITAAYALVDVGFSGHARFHLLQSLACAVPVIAPRIPVLEELGEHAFIFYEARNMEELAVKMMLLYKDEAFRSQHIRNTQSLRQQTQAPSLFSALDRLFSGAAKRV